MATQFKKITQDEKYPGDPRKSTILEEIFSKNHSNNDLLSETNILLTNNISRLERIINKINPDGYYKNTEVACGDCAKDIGLEKSREPLSGMMLDMKHSLKITEEKIDVINLVLITELSKAIDFIEEHI